jgi:hypothetical protein
MAVLFSSAPSNSLRSAVTGTSLFAETTLFDESVSASDGGLFSAVSVRHETGGGAAERSKSSNKGSRYQGTAAPAPVKQDALNAKQLQLFNDDDNLDVDTSLFRMPSATHARSQQSSGASAQSCNVEEQQPFKDEASDTPASDYLSLRNSDDDLRQVGNSNNSGMARRGTRCSGYIATLK